MLDEIGEGTGEDFETARKRWDEAQATFIMSIFRGK